MTFCGDVQSHVVVMPVIREYLNNRLATIVLVHMEAEKGNFVRFHNPQSAKLTFIASEYPTSYNVWRIAS